MATQNLGRVQGAGIFYSSATSSTSVAKNTISPTNISPLVGDSILFANGDVRKITAVGSAITCGAVTANHTGANGTNGVGVSSATVTYQSAGSGTIAPTGTWLSSVPYVSQGNYLWTRTITTYTNSTTTTTYSVARQGVDGEDGGSSTLYNHSVIWRYDTGTAELLGVPEGYTKWKIDVVLTFQSRDNKPIQSYDDIFSLLLPPNYQDDEENSVFGRLAHEKIIIQGAVNRKWFYGDNYYGDDMPVDDLYYNPTAISVDIDDDAGDSVVFYVSEIFGAVQLGTYPALDQVGTFYHESYLGDAQEYIWDTVTAIR